MRINFSNAREGFRILLAHLWCLINVLLLLPLSNHHHHYFEQMCYSWRCFFYLCEESPFCLSSYHKYHDLNVAQGQRSKFKDHVHSVTDKVMVDAIDLAEEKKNTCCFYRIIHSHHELPTLLGSTWSV